MRARGKREAQRNASPLVNEDNLNRALKVRNNSVDYSALSELHDHCACLPGATRLTLFGACPWLSYSAPLALGHIPRRLRGDTFRAVCAGTHSAPFARGHIPRRLRGDIFRAVCAGTYPRRWRGDIFRAFGAGIDDDTVTNGESDA